MPLDPRQYAEGGSMPVKASSIKKIFRKGPSKGRLEDGMATQQQTPSSNGIHFYANWAKERIDEIDATLSSLESKAGEVQAEARTRANQLLADLRAKRDEFRNTIKKQAESNEAAWINAKTRLESDWTAFEAQVQKYVETFAKQAEQQHALFQARTTAQLKSLNEVTDRLFGDAKEFAAERRAEIDATVKRMKADATARQEKLDKLSRAGSESWAALNAALAETRAAFDRANQAARDAFNRVK
jgi:hypothetical protein